MKTIPTQLENEAGLHQRYYIQKVVRQPVEFMGEPCEDQLVLREVDPTAEYFVMRLDAGGKDQKHIEACRIGVLAYANAIADHLPELSKDLIERYPPTSPSKEQSIMKELMEWAEEYYSETGQISLSTLKAKIAELLNRDNTDI